MAFFPPIPLIRKNAIIKRLTKCKAFSEESAKYLDEIGLINPYAFSNITKRLVSKGIINKTNDGKYYINRNETKNIG